MSLNSHSIRLISLVFISSIFSIIGYAQSIIAEESLFNPDALYDHYAQIISKKWPFPQYDQTVCQNDMHFWKKEALKLIDISNLKLKGETGEQVTIERYVLRYALIAHAYNRLYIEHASKSPVNFLQWISIAAHAAPIVGKSFIRSYNVNRSSRMPIIEAPRDDRNPFLITTLIENSLPFIIGGGKGQKDIYSDIFWQMFAAHFCGPQIVKKIVQSEKQNSIPHSNSYNHYAALEQGWIILEEAINSSPVNYDLIEKGSMAFVWVEQHNVLQKMYDETVLDRMAHKLQLLNTLAVWELPDAEGKKILSFDEFCIKNKIERNLANFDSRFSWMVYVLKKHVGLIDLMQRQGMLKKIFLPHIKQSAQILEKYYN